MKNFPSLIFLLGLFSVADLFAQSNTDCEIQNLKCVSHHLINNLYVDLYRKNGVGKTSLHIAVENNNTEVARLILQNDLGVISLVDAGGNTALHRAVSLNEKEMVQTILDFSPDVNLEDRNGETALDMARAVGYLDLIDLLSTHGGISKKQNNSSTTTIWLYLVYIILSILVTVWVARTLSNNGKVFLVDAFKDSELANSVNHLLVVGFYLINLGYITMALKIGLKPNDMVEAVEILSNKVGIVILLLGCMHFFNLYLFGRLRKRTLLKKELGVES